MDKILEVARQSGSEAIHPGYGFMSESTIFAKQVTDAGMVFIGPPAEAIRSMGSKRESKEIMLAAGVPCVPLVPSYKSPYLTSYVTDRVEGTTEPHKISPLSYPPPKK